MWITKAGPLGLALFQPLLTGILASHLGSDLQRHLKSVFSSWCAHCLDTHMGFVMLWLKIF